jgi:hypothetical protein
LDFWKAAMPDRRSIEELKELGAGRSAPADIGGAMLERGEPDPQ